MDTIAPVGVRRGFPHPPTNTNPPHTPTPASSPQCIGEIGTAAEQRKIASPYSCLQSNSRGRPRCRQNRSVHTLTSLFLRSLVDARRFSQALSSRAAPDTPPRDDLVVQRRVPKCAPASSPAVRTDAKNVPPHAWPRQCFAPRTIQPYLLLPFNKYGASLVIMAAAGVFVAVIGDDDRLLHHLPANTCGCCRCDGWRRPRHPATPCNHR